MLTYFETTLTWRDLLRKTYRDAMEDDALGLAAQLAYYFVLALFPAILCLLALASFLPLQNFTDEIVASLGPFAPDAIVSIIRDQMVRLAEGNDGGLLSLGLLGAVWSSSAAMVALIGAMNKAYDIEEARPWWRVRVTAILLTIGLSVFIVLSFGLIVAGPEIADWMASAFGFGRVFITAWTILQWPVAFALIASAIALIYYFAPDADQEFVWITPGSLVATMLLLLGSLGFRFYVVNFGSYEATYGAIAGVILLMLWFYLTGLALVIGAEVSAEIEHASPWGKKPGEKMSGEKIPRQRKKIGLAASREHRRRPVATHPAQQTFHPSPHTAPAVLRPSWLERVVGIIVFGLVWRRSRTR